MEKLYPVLLTLSVVFTMVSFTVALLFYRKYKNLIAPRKLVNDHLSSEDQKLIRKLKDPLVNGPCREHGDRLGQGICAICSAVFCEECVKEYDGLNFCIEHFKTYLEHDWEGLETVLTTPDTPEVALPLYRFKKTIWKEDIPSIIRTHYRINIEQDLIESHVSLMVRRDDFGHMDQKWKLQSSSIN